MVELNTFAPPKSARARLRSVPSILSIRMVLFVAAAAYIFVPILAVFLYAFATRWTSNVLPDGYTLQHWAATFTEPRFGGALARSLLLALATAVMAVVLVTPAVYWQRVRNPMIRPVLEIGAAIPFAIPFMVIAFGLLQVTGDYLPSIQGTIWLLLPAHVAVAFSFVYWAIDNSMASQNVVLLSEAARSCGAGYGTILRKVILPNIGPGIVSGAILAFGMSFNELAIVQILAGSRFETIPLYTLNLLKSTDADFNVLAVITAVTFFITLALSVTITLLSAKTTASGPH